MSKKNLIPFDKMTASKHRELSKKGAEASNKKQKENKQFRELAQLMLSMKISDKKLKNKIKEMFPELLDDELTAKAAMIYKQFEKAVKFADSQAFQILRDTAGEKPTDETKNILDGEITIKWQ
jgi:hypothetical protein